ncbi:MAG: rhomboid family intramembrane serine protease [Polyangiaceae bacterium]|jgi:membrane associated rhomboid family serine protease|nr:rhomboid family intramembrane serine protease [Polyangiaceae bacterium]
MLQRRPDPPATLAVATAVKARATIVGSMVGVMWVQEIVDALVFRGWLDNFGIRPRTLFGLVGIVCAPFLHADFAHLIANTIPLAVLAFLIMMRKKRDLAVVTVLSALVGGLGIWLVGRGNSVHLGASILVFGYLGYMLSRGIFERSFWSIVGSVVVFLVYGGALFGVLPGQAGVSWEGHLFGFAGGVLAARLLANRAPRVPAPARLPAAARR